ncbi:ATP-binding cassette transporter [Clonorchis sinensis]|uniref:ATP-binding cassette transporter n=1 Tax=Clonorchis sinensis TaxID=79923 RepID=G7Y913_CLOSI|nr:ATP-binding cassette transporter [Clonorchis sinensis]
MSDDDAELKDVLIRSLSENGILSRLKVFCNSILYSQAQLRAAVYLALEKHNYNDGMPQTNDAVRTLQANEDVHPKHQHFGRRGRGRLHILQSFPEHLFEGTGPEDLPAFASSVGMCIKNRGVSLVEYVLEIRKYRKSWIACTYDVCLALTNCEDLVNATRIRRECRLMLLDQCFSEHHKATTHKLGRPGSIPALVLPSSGMAVRHRKGATAERFLSSARHMAPTSSGISKSLFKRRHSVYLAAFNVRTPKQAGQRAALALTLDSLGIDKAKEMEETQKAGNARRLFQLIRATGPRKPPVSETIKDRNGTTISNKEERLD